MRNLRSTLHQKNKSSSRLAPILEPNGFRNGGQNCYKNMIWSCSCSRSLKGPNFCSIWSRLEHKGPNTDANMKRKGFWNWMNICLMHLSSTSTCFSVYLFLSPFLLGWVPVRGPNGRLWRAFRLCINRNVYWSVSNTEHYLSTLPWTHRNRCLSGYIGSQRLLAPCVWTSVWAPM